MLANQFFNKKLPHSFLVTQSKYGPDPKFLK